MSRRAAPSINCSQARDGSQAPAPVPVCGRFRAFPPALHLALDRGAAPGAETIETGRAARGKARGAKKMPPRWLKDCGLFNISFEPPRHPGCRPALTEPDVERSEARRGGEEGVSTCGTRGSRYHK